MVFLAAASPDGLPPLVHYDLPRKMAEADATNPNLCGLKSGGGAGSEGNLYQSIEDLKIKNMPDHPYEAVKVEVNNCKAGQFTVSTVRDRDTSTKTVSLFI